MKHVKYFFKKLLVFLRTSEYAILLLCVALSFGLFQLSFQTHDQTLFIGSKAWSDFGAHIPLIRSFSFGNNWPPEYPLFAGEPIRYHFLFYAAVGLLEKFGLNLGLALNGLSACGFGLLLWMLYRVAKLIFNSKAAGWWAIWFGLMNSSLSAWIFADKQKLSWLQLSDWPALWTAVVQQMQFASFGPWDGNAVSAFWTLNIFTNQRHLGLSLGLVWWVIWPLLVLWWQPKIVSAKLPRLQKILLGVRVGVMAIFPLLHQAGAIVTAGMTVMLLGLSILNKEVRSSLHRWLVGVYLLGLALMGLVLLSFVPASHSAPQIVIGFLSDTKTLTGILDYWGWNLGVGLVILVVGLLWKQRGRTLLWLVTPFFIAANIWQFSPDMINNHKFVNFVIQAIAIVAAGWLLAGWELVMMLAQVLRRSRSVSAFLALPLAGVVLAAVVVFWLSMSLSGIVDLVPILRDRPYTVQDWQQRPIAVWLQEHTTPTNTLLTTSYFYNPASLVGRKLFLDYGYFAWSLGYEDRARRDTLPELFGDFETTEAWCQRLQTAGIDVVVLSPESELGEEVNIPNSFMVRQLKPTFVTDDRYTIYQLSLYCQ